MDRVGEILYKSNMARPQTQILNYNLFGEVGDLPDVVHCETIEARSLLHDWEFAPHRHGRLHQILWLQHGEGRVTLDGVTNPLRSRKVVNVPTGCVHGYTFEPATVGLVVTLAAETLDEALQPSEGLRQVLARAAVISATAAVTGTMTELAQTFGGRDFARAQILRSLAGLLLGQVARQLVAADDNGPANATPPLLNRFETLLDQHYAEHWSVADYADALAISPTHLTRISRLATGRPATRMIEERIIREARRNLVYTNLSVSAIAYALGYADPAYFTRVFTRATGLSPREFRSRAAGDDR
ncbi:MAG: helix-turn-helix domain-containing protein [Gammaproteobacteria bacterium]|nr:helix-turn-helix domain-containing protein [Gammaproteobacteria bacterium]